ncbi:hypothetical protein LCGC14_2492300 [marine sediment metagenome]|uniref:Uncharacterized protein n=1 Tax=marine sediment metagenome TaxID=412755 RepID=A0A0F9B556_9ZZZZ
MTHYAHRGRVTEGGGMFFGPKELAPKSADMGVVATELLDDALVATRKAEYAATRGSGQGEVALKRIGAGYIGVECDPRARLSTRQRAAAEKGKSP